MSLDDELAIAFVYNTAKQDPTNLQVILHERINTIQLRFGLVTLQRQDGLNVATNQKSGAFGT